MIADQREQIEKKVQGHLAEPEKMNPPPIQLGLAPMEGVTTYAMRLWFHLVGGVPQMTTPFLRATHAFPKNRLPGDFVPELELNITGSYKLIPQIMAVSSEDFLRAAKFLPNEDLIELNCGCPAPTSVGSGAGSALLQHPRKWRSMLEQIINELGPGRLAVKMRLGLADASLEFPKLIEALSGLPLGRLTIHGRTRQDRYLGKSNWNLIDFASCMVGVPVFGSGDICDLDSYLDFRSRCPKVKGVLIGRGALRFPWIFHQIEVFERLAIRQDLRPMSVEITFQTLELMLRVYQILEDYVISFTKGQEGFLNEKEALLNLGRHVLSLPRADASYSSWLSVLESLEDKFVDRLQQSGDTKRPIVVLGRLKMFWNYIRFSLDDAFHTPLILRSKSIRDFYIELQKVNESFCGPQGQSSVGNSSIFMSYHPEWDWVYAGGGKSQPEPKDALSATR